MQTEPNIIDSDGVYEMLIDAHSGLSPDESVELDSRLILLLANRIGDLALLTECIDAARGCVLRARQSQR